MCILVGFSYSCYTNIHSPAKFFERPKKIGAEFVE